MKFLLVLMMLVFSTSLFSQISFDLKYFTVYGNEWQEVSGSITWDGLNFVINDDQEDYPISIRMDGSTFKIESSEEGGKILSSWDAEVILVDVDIQYKASILLSFDKNNDLVLNIYSEEENVNISYFAVQQPKTI